MGKKASYKPKAFETAGIARRNGKDCKDTSANIFESMTFSEAWKDLTDRQRVLYLVCKLQYYGHRKPRVDYPDAENLRGDDLFYLNWHTVSEDGKCYQMYKGKSHSSFYKDMNALIEHGFIDREISGKSHKQKSIYRYSSRWRTWTKS